jgi:hypothetical protein
MLSRQRRQWLAGHLVQPARSALSPVTGQLAGSWYSWLARCHRHQQLAAAAAAGQVCKRQ